MQKLPDKLSVPETKNALINTSFLESIHFIFVFYEEMFYVITNKANNASIRNE